MAVRPPLGLRAGPSGLPAVGRLADSRVPPPSTTAGKAKAPESPTTQPIPHRTVKFGRP